MKVRDIELAKICTDQTQTRSNLREQTVIEYSELIQAGKEMDPAVVFDVDGELHLSAGAHRRAAYKMAGRTTMPCEVRKGTLWDAIESGIMPSIQSKIGRNLIFFSVRSYS